MVNQINHDHAIAQKHLSRSYLTIIIEFSSHSQLLADQKFFRWLHKMLCQFIDQSTEKGDKELEEVYSRTSVYPKYLHIIIYRWTQPYPVRTITSATTIDLIVCIHLSL